MPHVSKNKLHPKLLDKMLAKLVKIVDRAQNKGKIENLLNELLTHTEKIMLAKRLAIIIMISGSTPHHRIAEVLKVSPTTVSKMSLAIEIGKYKTIEALSKKEKTDLEKLVWNILTVGGIMPPKIGGRKYWQELRKN